MCQGAQGGDSQGLLCADWTVETESRCALALAPSAWDLAAGWVAGPGRWRDATSLARVGAARLRSASGRAAARKG